MGAVVKAVSAIAAVFGGPVGILVSIGLVILSRILAPKPKPFEGSSATTSFGARQRARIQTIRSTVAPRQVIYGETVVSGPLIAAFSSGTDNEFLHLFVALAGHEVDSISNVWLNDTLSDDSKFSGLVRVNTHIGTPTQAADSDAVSEITEWTTAHQLKGIAYVYVRLKWDQDVWITGIPNIKAQVKGKKILDTRTATTAWSDNPILCERDFLVNEFGASATDVDDTITNAQANICDEDVTLDAGGTQTRYICNGSYTKDQQPINIMEELKSSCAGVNTRQQGLYKLFAGAFTTPEVELSESDLRGDLELQTKDSRKDLFNAVKGEFVDADNGYLPTNFPPLTNATYEAEDGLQIFKIVELPFTDNGIRAQRISKIHLQRARQGVKVFFPAKMTAFPLTAWDTVKVTIAKLGWTSKSFRVLSWSLSIEGGIDLQLQEDVAADWAWSAEELLIDVPTDMPVVDPNAIGIIPVPTGLAATARRLEIVLTWTAATGSITTGYDIQRADDSGFSTNLVTLATDHDSNQFIDDLGSKATQRYYRIRGRGGVKRTLVSAFTSGVNATTAGIDTAEIVDNAVTVEAASSTAGDINAGTTFVTIETISITTEGGPIVVFGKCEQFASRFASFNTFQLYHAASATVIDEIGVDNFFSGSGGNVRIDTGVAGMSITASLLGVFSPTAGAQTIIMRMKNSVGTDATARFRGMAAFELKK